MLLPFQVARFEATRELRGSMEETLVELPVLFGPRYLIRDEFLTCCFEVILAVFVGDVVLGEALFAMVAVMKRCESGQNLSDQN